MAYQSKLEELNNDLLILLARSAFESSPVATLDVSADKSGRVSSTNPKNIDEETRYYKQYLNKLKFIYLEQETRDKFLRQLLLDENDFTNPIDQTKNLLEQNESSKAQLKSLKNNVYTDVDKLYALSLEVVEINSQYQSRLDEVNRFIKETESMNEQVDNLVKEIESNEDHAVLLNVPKAIDFQITDMNEIIDLGREQLSETVKSWEVLQNELQQKFSLHQEKLESIQSLQRYLVSLENKKSDQLQNGTNPADETNELQLNGQFIKQLNHLLRFFIDQGDQIDIIKAGDNYQMTLASNNKVVVSPELSVVKVMNDSDSSLQLVKEVNQAENDSLRLLKLSQLLQAL